MSHDTPGAGPELPTPVHDPAHVKQTAHDILAGSEFKHHGPSVFERIVRWIGDEIGRLFNGVGGHGSTPAGWIVLAVVVVAAVYALFRFARGVQRDPAQHETAPVAERRRATEWLEEARRLETEGRYKEAMRARYRALVGSLIERGVVEEIAGRTSGEYRREVATAAPTTAADFAGATELFERAWYGDEPTGATEAEQFGALAQRVLTGVGR